MKCSALRNSQSGTHGIATIRSVGHSASKNTPAHAMTDRIGSAIKRAIASGILSAQMSRISGAARYLTKSMVSGMREVSYGH